MASNDSLSHHFRQVGLRQLNKEATRLTKDEIHSIFLKLADTLTAKQRVISSFAKSRGAPLAR